ncbi:MbtH family protein [Streptomyces sp. NPDC058195]|uniref:MbtH family protein n=1 Tax=Streptomyces sp. NPDC058195 TaxID=3346375 RepID=UPI0036E0093F
MTNPFDDPDGSYHVLVNQEKQYSIWPSGISVPEGWSPAFGPDTRDACVDYVGSCWNDIRPASLRATP